MKKYGWVLMAVVVAFYCFSSPRPLCAGDFEGFWVAQTVTESNNPMMAGRETTITEETVYYKNGRIRHELKSDQQLLISRVDLGLMWTIDLAAGTYTEMKFEDVKAGIEKAQNAMKSPEMQEAFKDMSPEQRQMMEKMLGKKTGKDSQFMNLDLKIKRTGKREKISGEDCEIVNVLRGESEFMKLWLTNKYEIGAEFYKTYERMGLTRENPVEIWKDLKGFPMKTVVTIDMGSLGKTQSISTIQKVVRTSVADDKFELPGGLKKQKNPMLEMMKE